VGGHHCLLAASDSGQLPACQPAAGKELGTPGATSLRLEGGRRDAIDVAANGLIALARSCLQAYPIDDLDAATVIADEPCLLQRPGDDRYGRSAHAQQLRYELVSELHGVAFEPVVQLQQPATQTRLDRMQGIAGRALLSLDQQHLAVARDEIADLAAF